MKIKTCVDGLGGFLAVDDDTYDGPGCAIGCGKTEDAAILDLLDQLPAVTVKPGFESN